jgi:hypothetical protein
VRGDPIDRRAVVHQRSIVPARGGCHGRKRPRSRAGRHVSAATLVA